MKRPADALPSTTPMVPSTLKSQRKLHVGVDWLNTTWRILVPVVLGTAIGIVLDTQFTTAPWLTIFGTIAGFVLATALVARLLKEVAEAEQEGDSQ